MGKKKIKIKRVDGVVQGYHVGRSFVDAPSVVNIPKFNASTFVVSDSIDNMYSQFTQDRSEKVREQVEVLEWDDDIATSVVDSMPDISHTTPGLLANKLYWLSKQNNIYINYDKFSPQALASQMGYVLEAVYEKNFNLVHSGRSDVTYVKGGGLSKRIKETRKSGDLEKIEKLKNEMKSVLLFTDSYVDSVMQVGQAVHLPDVIVVDRSGGIVNIKCAEMKASGQNDSSSVPENIDKMAYGTRNSAVEPYKGRRDVTIERAILITAASSNARGDFTAKNAWVNVINRNRRKVGDIKVFCNQDCFSWLSGVKLTAEVYDKNFLNTTAYAQLQRIKNSS